MLEDVAIVNPTPTLPTQRECSELLDYSNWRIDGIRCSVDPLRREMCVTTLMDNKALLIVGCETGAYNAIDPAWVVSRTTPLTSRAVRLSLPFKTDVGSRDVGLASTTSGEKSRELVILAKGRELADCGIQTRWRYDGQRFHLMRCAQEPSYDNWHGLDAWPTLWITR